ncbi:MAG: primosomal protein N' [Chloroflexota bacterium]|nr:primosomal protein N' [Dehalococcoidia bacterium]MDW8252682.1 primosomal protein N' [Chloroflexota bacterium]
MATRRPAYAAVAVDAPPVFHTLFSYRIPDRLTVVPGQAVVVPFGPRLVAGIVAALECQPPLAEIRDLAAAISDGPLLTPAQVAVACWLAEHYRCPPFLAMRLWLPPDFPRRIDPVLRLAVAEAPLDPRERAVRDAVAAAPGLRFSRLVARESEGPVLVIVERLLQRGILTLEMPWRRPAVPVPSQPPEGGAPQPASPPSLTPAQQRAWQQLAPILAAGGTALLFGVTGAGKTELYLRALDAAMARGRRGVVLVPEIALTPQLAARFEARFPGRVAVIHSRLAVRERRRAWQRLETGEAAIVIGPRSALFAPVPDVGVIILDEEHDPSFKQGEAPRYHARAVARQLAAATGASVLFGSATPAIESFYAAQRGEVALVELGERFGGVRLPEVTVVDLRAELRAGNRGMFSRLLRERLAGALARREQVILYLNHRGAASVVLCRDCGYTAHCSRCDTVLTYHASQERLLCHLCNARRRIPIACPACGSRRIRYLGLGTERVVAEVEAQFPGARVLRLDSDVGGAAEHERILRAFAAGEGDVLVGTQLVAKGLDLPGVSLVGVVNADIGLYLPDFRAPERVFQQLTQAVGRPGRSGGGEAVIQTYSPDHYVIQAAARHDYLAFYEHEIAHRRRRRYPPFSQLARLLYANVNEERARAAAAALRARLEAHRRAEGCEVDILGPAPAYFRRVRGRYRWQIVLRGDDVAAFLRGVAVPPAWQVDVDPESLL